LEFKITAFFGKLNSGKDRVWKRFLAGAGPARQVHPKSRKECENWHTYDTNLVRALVGQKRVGKKLGPLHGAMPFWGYGKIRAQGGEESIDAEKGIGVFKEN